MKRYCGLMAGCALFVMSGAAAYADCAEDLAALHGEAGGAPGAIAMDGSLAPLEDDADAGDTDGDSEAASGGETTGSGAEAETQARGEGISKDGTLAPLEGAGAEVATSQQDAQAQQAGEETAAQEAESGSEGSARMAALDRAQAALDAGDEAGCSAALEEARSL